jgi:hypothetical protein
MARALSGNRQTAEDFVQETFLRALRHFDSYRGGIFRAWMAAIMRNLHRDRPMTPDMPADKAAMDAPGDFNGWSRCCIEPHVGKADGADNGRDTGTLHSPFAETVLRPMRLGAGDMGITLFPHRHPVQEPHGRRIGILRGESFQVVAALGAQNEERRGDHGRREGGLTFATDPAPCCSALRALAGRASQPHSILQASEQGPS